MRGRRILTGVAAATAVGGVLADANRTHLFNPAWTPHARLHDAMTVTLGALLGGTALRVLHRRHGDPEGDLAMGALLPALFWIAQGAAFAVPGTAGLQDEFPELVPRVRGVWLDERFASAAMLALAAAGYAAARRELRA